MLASLALLLLTPMAMALAMVQVPHIDWCLYWRFLNKDQYRPECNGVYRLRFAKHKAFDHQRPQINAPVKLEHEIFDQCRPAHWRCQRSSRCSSGQLCIDVGGYCCGNERILTSCPSPDTLVDQCARSRRAATNWCTIDAECSPQLAPRHNSLFANLAPMRSRAMCCPTSCGYNVCIR
ncbi:unnamed protein product [Caenorhabditis bovis]|uniref:WAP domain-containing protein n=1 Tax=Caenorhabditis bovis TaxID=2654633 RepID=A0A8S1EVL3_9PELO|nr:unnamed protein product [Caenorhabditis bovis]